MLNKLTSYIVLLVLLVSCDTKENLPPRDEKVFLRYYGGSYNDSGNAVQQTLDGGYIIVGTTSSLKNGSDTDIYVVKLDNKGIVEFERNLGGDGNDEGIKVQVLPSGNFFVAGNISNGTDQDIVFYELNTAGLVVNEYTYSNNGFDDIINDAYYYQGVIYGIGTTEKVETASSGNYDVVAIRCSFGNIIPLEEDFFGNEGDDKGVAIEVFNDGNAFLFWDDDKGSSLFKSSTNIWRKNPFGAGFLQPEVPDFDLSLFDDSNEKGSDAVLCLNGDLVYCATITSKSGLEGLHIYRIRQYFNGNNPAIEILWHKVYYFNSNVVGVSICELIDKNLVISATATTTVGLNDIMVLKLDQWGNQVFNNPVYYGGLLDDTAGEIIEDAEGKLLLTGTITFENKLKATLIKTNPSGGLSVEQ